MKSFTVMLTAALVLCLAGTATAYQRLGSVQTGPPDTPASQDLRSPDSVTPVEPAPPASQDLRSPDSVTPVEPAAPPDGVSSGVTVPDDGGLSPLLIVLISLSGALALAGAAYGTRRFAHAHHGPPLT